MEAGTYADEVNYGIGCVLPPPPTCATDLIAGGGNEASATDVGDFLVWKEDGTWKATYETTGTWEITEIHLDVACDPSEVPQTKKDNPIPGKFCYFDTPAPGTQSYTFDGVSPVDCHGGDPCDGGCAVFAAHAVVVDTASCDDAPLDEECTLRTETAWAWGDEFPGKNWATYFECCGPSGPVVTPGYSGLTEAAGVRYRGNSSGNEIYLGIPDLGVGGNRVEASYPNVYANWQDGTYKVTFSFDQNENKIVRPSTMAMATVDLSSTISTICSLPGALWPIGTRWTSMSSIA